MNETKKTIAIVLSSLAVLAALWVSVYAISVQNRSAEQEQADTRASVASKSIQTSYHRGGF